MTQLWVLALLLGVTSSLKHLEQREIKTSEGQIFNCFYTINYNAKARAGIIKIPSAKVWLVQTHYRQVQTFKTELFSQGAVNKKKTSVTCDPNKNGGTAIEVFDLAKVGKISLKHSVKKGKEVVQDFSPYSAPDTSSAMPMNCSCKVPFPTEMMEMMGPETPAGRRLAPMLMSHDTESNRKILKVDRGLNRIGPLLLLCLLPQIIAAIQAESTVIHSRVEHSHWSRSSRYSALIGRTLLCWRHGLCHDNTPQGIQNTVSFGVLLWHNKIGSWTESIGAFMP